MVDVSSAIILIDETIAFDSYYSGDNIVATKEISNSLLNTPIEYAARSGAQSMITVALVTTMMRLDTFGSRINSSNRFA